jgi:hypothetical protein
MRHVVKRVYDHYGSHEPDIKRLSERVIEATGLAFTRHESYFQGEYYLATVPDVARLTIEPNELEDEDGPFLRLPQYAGWETLLLAAAARDGDGASGYLDGLRDKLEGMGLVFLERKE